MAWSAPGRHPARCRAKKDLTRIERDCTDFADWYHGRDARGIATSHECIVNNLGKPMLPEVVDNQTRDPRWCSEGSMPPELIREIRAIAFQSALGLPVVETSRPGRLRPSANSMD